MDTIINKFTNTVVNSATKLLAALVLFTGTVLTVFSPPAPAFTDFGTIQVTTIDSIYDADTFRITVDGWPAIAGRYIPVRANGFDAPEIRGKCVEEKEQALQAKHLTYMTLKQAEAIELRNTRRGKYFRILADVYVLLDNKWQNLADIQINSGLSRPYHGGKRQGWCSVQQ